MKKKYGTSLIIGNGFDLNLGMVTDYRSFFKKLKADGFFAKHTNNPLLQFINAKGEKENGMTLKVLFRNMQLEANKRLI